MRGMRAYLNKKGFTLAESLIASALTAISVMALYGSMIMSQMIVASARHHNEAQCLAMDRLWTVFNWDYEVLKNTATATAAVSTNSVLFPLGGTMRTAVLVFTNHCQVQVRVDWNQRTYGGGTNTPYELYWADRYQNRRGPT